MLVLVAACLVGLGAANGAGAAPAQAPAEPGATDWATVSAGGDHTCGIRTSGALYCWGQDTYGQLGDGGANTDQPAPVQVGGATNWSKVSAGTSHTCAVKTNGRLFGWGRDHVEQLGDGFGTTDQTTPVRIGSAANWVAVDAGGAHTCGRRTTGRLFCWGSDTAGRLGDDPVEQQQPSPVEVAGGATDWASFDAGAAHSCAIKTTGQLYCWGGDSFLQLGDGDAQVDQLVPVRAGANRARWTSVAVGDFHTCAIKTNGRLYCWGSDDYNQRGEGPTNEAYDGDPVRIGSASDWTVVAAGRVHTCARNTARELHCWGNDDTGQVGNDAGTTVQPAPVEVDGAATDWGSLAVGRLHTCARRTTDALYCWGFDDSGQLGDGGADANQMVPVQI